jgi:hypothetical protein
VGLAKEKLLVLTHGFVLGQYGLLWARQRADQVEKLAILNVPLGRKTALRPELAPYKAAMPFLRPKPDTAFSGDLFNAAGLAYAMQYDDAQVRILECNWFAHAAMPWVLRVTQAANVAWWCPTCCFWIIGTAHALCFTLLFQNSCPCLTLLQSHNWCLKDRTFAAHVKETFWREKQQNSRLYLIKF